MEVKAVRTGLKEIQVFRQLYLQEANTQIRYDSVHVRGWSDSYLLMAGDVAVGYGSVHGQEIKGRDTVFEFYVIPAYRGFAAALMSELLTVSAVRYIECQSNDPVLPGLFYAFAENIRSPVILFKDDAVTSYPLPGFVFRFREDEDALFEHRHEPEGDYVLEWKGEIVASGGFLLHYNMPFADLYMEVKEDWRRKGLGSYLIQEIKKQCYLAGRVPAARCNIDNIASKATLLKAGLKIAGYMLIGEVKMARR